MPPRECQYCRARRPDDLNGCPYCGAEWRSSFDSKEAAHAVTMILGPASPPPGAGLLSIEAPGYSSKSTLSVDGEVVLRLNGSKGLGTYGEPRVRHVLYEVLRRSHCLEVGTGARDADGEDGKLRLDGIEYILQVVSAVSGEHVNLSAASHGEVTISTTLCQLAQWLDETVGIKAQRTDPPNTVLALDASILGVAVGPRLIAAYHSLPSRVDHGFAAVWLVGQTPSYSFRLDAPGAAAT
jgi:hypothetical protein